ncbi:hydantoinase/oxoprolinase N-terminal domain-containing protein [Desulfopila sp. IMCC35008]|uniref:hydantoinase/oxoprolinase N-terminal domain-containing protein n=1 Tax=Desulfopila sp. IMCC35008 TaxID=2653858 RepID=UPI0013D2604A|nr:hydantoinase/oxoprolinase family protein [Desulfopila sp. IMCC35008]
MKKYIIGIDTGGTYTDAVLVNTETAELVRSVKRPTTHRQLSIGTADTLRSLLEESGIQPEQVDSLVISSTLATNSIVENKGARVALLVIGYVRHFKLPVKAVVYIKGGHTIIGEEEQPLDLEYLVEIVSNLKNEVDAYGVCSAMSIKNPAHELVAEKAISMLDPKPVFCSHRASSAAGMKERAATAGLHAKLMPIMDQYINGVKQAMDELELTCPMLVVGGNGTTTEARKAVLHAGSTVASGPACTAHFGSSYTTADGLVIDIGGTTTDIAMLQEGKPLLAQEGCRIGLWHTHVEAVDMVTGGIGGDSHTVVTADNKLQIGPARVVPLAMCSDIPPVADWLGANEESKLLVGYLTDSSEQQDVESFICRHNGVTPARLRKETGIGGVTLEKELERLTREQRIYECGFTPTDALHVLGKINIGTSKNSRAGATRLGALAGMDAESFSRKVLKQTEEQIETLILDYVIQHYWGNSLTGFLSERNAHPVLGLNFSLKIPLIGIGAAAPFLLEGVAQRLGTSVSFPPNGEVGNAMGAALLGLRASHKESYPP